MPLPAKLRGLLDEDGALCVGVLGCARDGRELRLDLAGPAGRPVAVLLTGVLEQPALFGEVLPEEELAGASARLGSEEIDRIGRRDAFTLVVRDGAGRERGYLCERIRPAPRPRAKKQEKPAG